MKENINIIYINLKELTFLSVAEINRIISKSKYDRHIIVDISELKRIDSSAIGLIISVYTKLKKHNKELILCEARKSVSKTLAIFESTEKIAKIVNTVDDAILYLEKKYNKVFNIKKILLDIGGFFFIDKTKHLDTYEMAL